MAIEDFQVILRMKNTKFKDVVEYMLNVTNVKNIDGGFFNYVDGVHLIEIEVREGGISMRFALCNPDTIDFAFLELVDKTKCMFSAELMNMESEYSLDLKESIRIKRSLWRNDFGGAIAALTCKEAIAKYILKETIDN